MSLRRSDRGWEPSDIFKQRGRESGDGKCISSNFIKRNWHLNSELEEYRVTMSNFDVECEIGDLARCRIHIYAFIEWTCSVRRAILRRYKKWLRRRMAMFGTLTRAACPRSGHHVGDWCVVDGSSGPISVFGTWGSLIALRLNAPRSHSARARPALFDELSQSWKQTVLIAGGNRVI